MNGWSEKNGGFYHKEDEKEKTVSNVKKTKTE